MTHWLGQRLCSRRRSEVNQSERHSNTVGKTALKYEGPQMSSIAQLFI